MVDLCLNWTSRHVLQGEVVSSSGDKGVLGNVTGQPSLPLYGVSGLCCLSLSAATTKQSQPPAFRSRIPPTSLFLPLAGEGISTIVTSCFLHRYHIRFLPPNHAPYSDSWEILDDRPFPPSLTSFKPTLARREYWVERDKTNERQSNEDRESQARWVLVTSKASARRLLCHYVRPLVPSTIFLARTALKPTATPEISRSPTRSFSRALPRLFRSER